MLGLRYKSVNFGSETILVWEQKASQVHHPNQSSDASASFAVRTRNVWAVHTVTRVTLRFL